MCDSPHSHAHTERAQAKTVTRDANNKDKNNTRCLGMHWWISAKQDYTKKIINHWWKSQKKSAENTCAHIAETDHGYTTWNCWYKGKVKASSSRERKIGWTDSGIWERTRQASSLFITLFLSQQHRTAAGWPQSIPPGDRRWLGGKTAVLSNGTARVPLLWNISHLTAELGNSSQRNKLTSFSNKRSNNQMLK